MSDFANPFEENPDDFDGVDWAERIGPRLPDQIEEHFEEVDRGDRYVRDWQYISHTYRMAKDYESENCCASFLSHTYLLHVHHRDHDKGNNEPANLIALCVLCHGEHHPHMQADISAERRELIIALRKRPLPSTRLPSEKA